MGLKRRLSVLRKNLPNLDPEAVGESQRTLTDAMQLVDHLKELNHGDGNSWGRCWCSHGIGSPMVTSHGDTCKALQSLLEDS